MKLLIQIPCYNEENSLLSVLSDLPKSIDGIDKIEIQVIDDGSIDNTVKIAKNFGVHYIIELGKNKGLATAFKFGADNAIFLGFDYLVNTDGDNQYQGKDIEKMVKHAINEKADLVIGCRPIKNHPEFSYIKKKLQILGSWVLRKVSGTNIEDAASGFRVYSRNALLRLNIYSSFSYCMESLIQLGLNNFKISSIKININPKTRKSRLFKNITQYIFRQALTIINIFLLYRTNLFFGLSASFSLLISIFLVLRYLVLIFFLEAPANDFWPSVILSGAMLIISILLFVTGIVASLFVANRKLSEEILFRLRKSNLK